MITRLHEKHCRRCVHYRAMVFEDNDGKQWRRPQCAMATATVMRIPSEFSANSCDDYETTGRSDG